MNLTKALIAEAIACCALTAGIILGISNATPIATPLVAALTILLFVYTIGNISGAHINPAVTVGLWSIGKITTNQGVQYILAQLVGAIVAVLLVALLGVNQVAPVVTATMHVFAAEIIGTFLLVFGISSVVYKKAPEAASGIVIGGSLLLGISMAASASNGVLNPAVAIGIQSINWIYLLAPLVGGVLGAQTGKYVFSK